MKTGRSRKAGSPAFTLVEVMLVLAIVLVAGMVIFSTTLAGNRSLAATQAAVTATQQARMALDRIARDLTRTPVSQITDGTGTDVWPPATATGWPSIRFRYPEAVDSDGVVSRWSNYIAYIVSGGQLLRVEGPLAGGGALLWDPTTATAMALRPSSGAWTTASQLLVIALAADAVTGSMISYVPADTGITDPNPAVVAGGGDGQVLGLALREAPGGQILCAVVLRNTQLGFTVDRELEVTVSPRNDQS